MTEEEQYILKVFQIIHTHQIVLLIIIKVYMVEHYVLKQIPSTKTQLIAISKIMLHKNQEEQYILKVFQIIQTHHIVFLKVIWLNLAEHYFFIQIPTTKTHLIAISKIMLQKILVEHYILK